MEVITNKFFIHQHTSPSESREMFQIEYTKKDNVLHIYAL